jgi:hypothetical protein
VLTLRRRVGMTDLLLWVLEDNHDARRDRFLCRHSLG